MINFSGRIDHYLSMKLNKFQEILKRKSGYLVITISLYVIITFITENWIFTEEFFYQNLSLQLPVYSIDEILESREKFWLVAYIIQIIIVLVKVFFASLCIFVGVVLTDIEVSFKDLFRSVVIAESIFIVANSIYLFNLYVHRTELTFETTANYFPLSMLSFWGVENIVPWLQYPLQTLNLFEVIYILCISWLLSKQWKADFIESINIVLPSYGIGLLIWMVLVVFLTLQVS